MMGGFVVQVDSTRNMLFKPEDAARLIHENIVEIPTLIDKDIDDHSKASWVSKSVALIQIIWFLTQLLARVIQRLPVTTLELFTLSIVSCAGFIYGFYWHKPFDVQRPIVLQSKVSSEYQWPLDTKRMKFGASAWESVNLPYFSTSFTIILIFSSCHLIGWNFTFPSEAEQWLWRAGSLCCLVLPFAIIIIVASEVDGWAMYSYSLVFLYVIVRIALFVEMFTSLRSAPADAYQTPRWTDYFPSFGT